jgi:hypothetical protein
MDPEAGSVQPESAEVRSVAIVSHDGLPWWAFWIAAISFLAVVLWINRGLFRVPIIEDGDQAANALQIQNAKHFHETLGNYSRWTFHHPGPAFFYIFAAGEGLFRDLLRLVPAAINAQVITIILLNTFFLFGAIFFFARHCRPALFLPASMLAAVMVIVVINRTIPGGALVSIWMPQVLLFCFLFFVTACASVASGSFEHLPLMALAGLMLMHGHVAQGLFVTVLAAAAVVTFGYRFARGIPMRQLWLRHRQSILLTGALAALFVFPVLMDSVVHRPSNLSAIGSWASAHRGWQVPLGTSLKYEASFLAFIPDPEVVLQNPSAHLLSQAGSRPYVLRYWLGTAFLLGVALGLIWRGGHRVHPFLRYVSFEIALISILFVLWGMKIAGGLYNFNGFFMFSLQILGFWVLIQLILGETKISLKTGSACIAACAVSVSILAVSAQFTNTYSGDPEVARIAALAPAGKPPLRLLFRHDDWPLAVGVASRMSRSHEAFCVERDWTFMFGTENVCPASMSFRTLRLDHPGSVSCTGSCIRLMEDGRYAVDLQSFSPRELPFVIGAGDDNDRQTGFDETEGENRWTRRESAIRFLLTKDLGAAKAIRIAVRGRAVESRPVRLVLNDLPLAVISGFATDTWEFTVDRSRLLAGGINELKFLVDRAGPIGSDPRTLGFYFNSVGFTGVE